MNNSFRDYSTHGRRASLYVLSTLPFFMFFFNKSAAALLVTVSIIAWGRHRCFGLREQFASFSRQVRADKLASIAVLSATIYTCASVVWSPNFVRSLDIMAGAWIVLLAATMTGSLKDADDDGNVRHFAFIAIMVCSAAVMIEEFSGMKFHQIIGVRSEPFALKRTMLCSTILFLALARFASTRFSPPVLIIAGLLQAGAIAAAHSGAAAFGVAGFCATIACRRLGGASAAKAACLAWIAGCLAIAPFLGAIADLSKEGHLVKSLRAFHLPERIEIWKAFGRLVQEKPLFGYGFGSSQEIVGKLVTDARFDPALEVIRELHPHNAYLQIWVEFGIVGVAAAFFIMLWSIRRMDTADPDFSVKLGLAMYCCFVMLLSHSLWQPWWIASVAAGIIWIRAGETSQDEPVSSASSKSAPAR